VADATVAHAAVEVRGVEKRFPVRGLLPWKPKGIVHALRGVDLSVPEGTIHGVIGPNGSGKSTLLRILATLIIADTGAASVGAWDVARDAGMVRRLIGFSTGEERSLYWRLTARQNLEFAAALHHVSMPDTAIRGALRLAGLTEAADRPVSGFSQGMSRRLSLARALLHEPEVLLLDEPTRSLDPVAKEEFQHALTALRTERGLTSVVTTHDLSEAATMCDAVSVLWQGRVVDHPPVGDASALEASLRGLRR